MRCTLGVILFLCWFSSLLSSLLRVRKEALVTIDYRVCGEQQYVFYSPDIHDGTRRDLALSLYHLNQSIIFASQKCSLPAYSIVHSMEMKSVAMKEIQFPSIVIADSETCSHTPYKHFDEETARGAFSTIEKYSKSSHIDAIICSFYPAECLNYIPTNKTIVFLPAHRFLLLLCDSIQISTAMYWMFESGLPNIHVLAMGVYDKEYINYYTGRDVPFLYASSIYEYNPPRERNDLFTEILVAPFKDYITKYSKTLNMIARSCNSTLTFVSIKEKLNRSFTYEDLNHFTAVVVFPYAVLSYYLCDLITAAIPMIVPSPQYFASHRELLVDYRNQDGPYCKGMAPMPERHNKSRHRLSPEDNSPDSRQYWVQYASFYTPCSITFDRLEDIPMIVEQMNVSSVYACNLELRRKMIKHNQKEWRKLIRSIRPRDMSTAYENALYSVNKTMLYS